jgi:para-nitrobenzyl esterase
MGTVIEDLVATVVHAPCGSLRGQLDRGVLSFRGIPYAAPPFGPRRLRPPQPIGPWRGVRDALVFGAEPFQPRMPAGDPTANLVWDPAEPGEDCLNINVWTPTPIAAGLPVMVWIPGGMFEVCSGAAYDGSRFARDGVVCVTINYRVGAEGFVFLADGVPNLGLLDQIAALEWVRDNIAAFGGDPDNVTVFGESAGAMSIGTLLAMPRAAGLFRRAILESGASHRVVPATTALRIGRALAERLQIDPTRDAFATVQPEHLLAEASALKADVVADPDPGRWTVEVIASMLPWQPVVDGDVLPGRPIELIAAGAGAGVDVLVGTNVDDWRLFVVANGSPGRVNDESIGQPVAQHGFESALAYGLTSDGLAAYRAAFPALGAVEALAAIETDWWCRRPAVRLAEARAEASGRTFMYEFAWPAPAFGGAFGACHGLEMPFVFDTLDLGPRQMLGGLLGSEPPQALADAMHRAWVQFATTGDPGWPRYEPARRATMRFDVASGVVDDPRRVERGLWATMG